MNGLTDFADWLSPMLVKELRQGVRSRIFVATLLLLQGSLVLLTIIGLLASDAQRDTGTVSAFFWVLSGIFLILFLPLSGLKAISQERSSNTLDLIFLTRLTSRRIVIGKWLAIVAQISLLVFTILPYIVLRYYLGGVDLWWELLLLGGLLLGSAVLTAITVGFSPLPAVLSRAVMVIGLIVGLYLLLISLAMMAMGRGVMMGVSLSTAWKSGFAAVVGAVFIMLFMLEFGAARIAPPAENHSSPLRLIGLAAIVAGAILDHFLLPSGGNGRFAAYFFALPILVGALCESPRMIVSIYRPFVRRGFFGKVAGRFLYPGWPSATLYVLLVVSALGLELYFEDPAQRNVDALLVVIIAGALLFPAAIIRLFGKRLRYPLAMYFGIQAIFALLYSFASVLVEFKELDLHPVLDAIPTCALLSLIFGDSHDLLLALLPIVATAPLLSVVALFWQSLGPWREIRAFEKKAELMKHDAENPAPSGAAALPGV